MATKTLRRWAVPLLIMLLFSLLLGPMSAIVQGNGLAELPLTEQYVNKYEGDYCVITKGASLLNQDSATFTIDVPGQPVAAFWNWSGRFIKTAGGTLPPSGDTQIRITGTLGDGSAIDQTITAAVEETSRPETWIRWYAYFYSDSITQYVRQGSNTYTVSDFDLPPGGRIVDTHGVALAVVYEAANCPLSQVELDYGLDTLFWDRQPPYGPNSSVACVELVPSSETRTLDYTMIVAGIADDGRPNSIWVASLDVPGNGLPDNLVDEAFASELANVLGKNMPEWDIYENQLTIDPGDNYACFQLESPPGDRNPGGVSAGWLSLNTTLELPVGSIGDLVWSDINGNGVKEAAEPGLGGVTVTLSSGGGQLQTTTDGSGFYLFEDLTPDTYTVSVDAGSGPLGNGVWVQTGDPDGSFDNQSQVVLAAGENNLDQDFGYQPLGSIGDTVWDDKNSNGAIDGNEKGIAGVTVTLRNAQGVVATTVTDQNGNYSFLNLPAGQYTVSVDPTTLPPDMIPTYDPDGIDTPHTVSLLLAPSESRDDIDFGYRSLLDILGDTVWNDLNGNGVQDPGEPGLNGVIVILTNSTGAQQTAVTNADGFYNFTDLEAGTYTDSIDTGTLPPGMEPTYDLDGIQTPHTTQVTLVPGQDRDDVDFGYKDVLGSIGDTVWQDDNSDGFKDPGEPGIANVTLTLTAADNSQTTTTTDANGIYTFADLPAGQYVVSVEVATLPANMQPTYDVDGIETPNKATVTLAEAEDRTDVDFGYQQSAGLGDTVWNDINGNGIQDGGEPGIGGVTLLLSAPGLARSTVTDANGFYSFTDLLAGAYTVSVNTSTLPVDLTRPTYDLDGVQTPNTATVTLSANQYRNDVDFGYQTPTAIDDGEPDDGDAGTTFIFVPMVNR